MARQPCLPNAATESKSDTIRIVTNFRDGTVRITHNGWSTKINCVAAPVLEAVRAGRGDWTIPAQIVDDVANGIQRALTYLLEDVSAKSLGDVVVEHLT